MAMLSARERALSDDTGRRMPGFVLATQNLDCYRPWLKRIREWARKKGGRVMESHLIGEEVPAEELTDEAIAGADNNIIGYPAEEGVGAEGGRRRQVRDPASYPVEQRVAASARYAEAGLATLSVSTVVAMTAAQRARYNEVSTQSGVWNQREAELCDALNNVVDGRPAKAIEVLGIGATAFARVRAIHSCYRKLSATRLKELRAATRGNNCKNCKYLD